MSKIQISFKIIENKPIIPDINGYYYQIFCYETNFKDIIYCSKNNKITDIVNSQKSLKYIINLMRKGKILGVGNLFINKEFFIKKLKRKKYNNINIFITDNNYKKIFPSIDFSKVNTIKNGITLSIEINIKYNVKIKDSNVKKVKLMRRNFSFQEKAKYKTDYSVKSTNNYLTTSTTNINTYNILNNCYDNDNLSENNPNLFSSEKYIINTPSYILNPPIINSPLSDSNINNKRKKIIKKEIISSSVSFKNERQRNKKKFNNNLKYKIFDFKNKLNQKTSRNNKNKFLNNKKKINNLVSQESSLSNKNSNSISQSSIIDSVLIEKNYDRNIMSNSINKIYTNESFNIPNLLFNKSAYNKDYEYNESIDFNIKEIEIKKKRIINEQIKRNKKLFNQEETEHNLISTLNTYESKIDINNLLIKQLKEKNKLLKYKEEIICEMNKEILPLISKVEESKEIEINILNLILNNYANNSTNKNKNNAENSIEKYNKNLMIKMLKNVIQNNYNIGLFLNDDIKNKLKIICDKYNIFETIIEEVEE